LELFFLSVDDLSCIQTCHALVLEVYGSRAWIAHMLPPVPKVPLHPRDGIFTCYIHGQVIYDVEMIDFM